MGSMLVDSDAMDELCNRIAELESATVVLPDQEICNGPFIARSGRTGWWTGWTPVVQNANVPNTVSDWYDIGNAVTGPDCLHEMKTDVDLGNHYLISRRNISYLWIDVQVLRNGTPCSTETFDTYWYVDQREDTNPDNVTPAKTSIEDVGNANLVCLNGPASATYQVQARTRIQSGAGQTFSYHRYIGGLRAEATFVFQPKTIVTGRV